MRPPRVRFSVRTLVLAIVGAGLLMWGARAGFGLWWAAQLDRKEAYFLRAAVRIEARAEACRAKAAAGQAYDPNRPGGRPNVRSWAEEASWLAGEAASCRQQAAVYARVRPALRPW